MFLIGGAFKSTHKVLVVKNNLIGVMIKGRQLSDSLDN